MKRPRDIDRILTPHAARILELLAAEPGQIEGLALLILTPTSDDDALMKQHGDHGKIVALVPAHVVRSMARQVPESIGDVAEFDRNIASAVDAGRLPIFVTLDGFVGLTAMAIPGRGGSVMNAPGGDA